MGGFLQAVDELAQVLDGIDVVVRRGADGVRSLGHHARAGHIAHDLRAGQMPADARLCPLPHLDLHSRACVQVFAVYAEPAGRHLHDGVGAVTVKILMQAALAGVVAHTQLRGRPRQRFMGIVADGPIAHGAEHDRHGQLDMRRFFRYDGTVFIPPDLHILFAQENPRLHGFAQRVDGRVRHLGGIDEDTVPVAGQRFRVAHAGKQHAARGRLAVYVLDIVLRPVCVLLERVVGAHDLQRPGGTQAHAPVAVDAFRVVRRHHLFIGVIAVHLVGALALTCTACDAALVVAHHLVLRIDKIRVHFPILPFPTLSRRRSGAQQRPGRPGAPKAFQRPAPSRGWRTPRWQNTRPRPFQRTPCCAA